MKKPKSISKPKTNQRSPEHYVRIIKSRLKRKPLVAEELRRAIAEGRRKDVELGWGVHRRFSDYDALFSQATGKPLVNALAEIPRKNNRPLVVLDDGAGHAGNFLIRLKHKLNAKGIPSKTIAVSLEPSFSLKEARKMNEIDLLRRVPAEFFVPKEPVDAIFSLYGSVHWTLNSLRKTHLLKYAFSLRKGGIMLVGFSPLHETSPKFFSGIEKAFAKKGFKAEIKKIYDELYFFQFSIPSHVLFVKRLR